MTLTRFHKRKCIFLKSIIFYGILISNSNFNTSNCEYGYVHWGKEKCIKHEFLNFIEIYRISTATAAYLSCHIRFETDRLMQHLFDENKDVIARHVMPIKHATLIY